MSVKAEGKALKFHSVSEAMDGGAPPVVAWMRLLAERNANFSAFPFARYSSGQAGMPLDTAQKAIV